MWDKKGDNLTRKWLYFLTEQQEKEKKVAKAVEDLVGKSKVGTDTAEKVTQKLANAGGNLIDKLGNLSDDELADQLAPLIQNLFSGTSGQAGQSGETAAPVDIKNLKGLARKNNLKYFGNEAGQPSAEWQSSITSPRKYNKKLNFILGSIPYQGTTDKPKIDPRWIQDNILRVNSPVGAYRINKHLAESLAAAIAESRAKYGLPLKNAGGFVAKGLPTGFSSHAWGAGIDFDSLVNPFSDSEGTLPPSLVRIARSEDRRTKVYWNFTNELAGLDQKKQTWKHYLDGLKPEKGERAISLYEFVAGPLSQNGIGAIFKKHGWKWGGHYRGRKDGMHFEFLG